MSFADILKEAGSGLATGAKAVGAVLEPVAKRTAEVVSGEAPQIDAEQRQQAQRQGEQATEAKAQQLESQLEMGRKYGTLNPDQQKQYVDAITQLYSHPSQMGTLVSKLHKMTHPDGATYQASPLTNATPKGGTQGADAQAKLGYAGQLAGQEDEQKKQQAVQSIDWFKKNMLPQFPPDQQATKLNEYIDHINGITQGTAKPPKGLKAMEQGGAFFGIEDQDTGKQYLTSQLAPGGDAPPEAKQMYGAVQKAATDKQAAADKKSEEANARQMKMFGHQLEMQNVGIQKAIELGDFREARKEVSKADEGYQAAADRMSTMDKASVKAKGGDQQAMFAILANHIAMTMQQPQVSARPTKAMFDEAASSLPWMANIQKKFDSNGYLLGVTLSPEQIDQMTGLAHDKVDTQKDHIDRLKSEYKDDLNPQAVTGAKKVGSILPKTGAQPVTSTGDSAVDRFLKSF
jgi:hypothetical protein